MIKLVATDIDGTLLPLGQQELSAETLELIDAVTDAGIIFCPTSGRQRESLERLFGSRAGRCTFITDCGAAAWQGSQCLASSPMPRAVAEAVIDSALAVPQCEVLVSAQNGQLYFFAKECFANEQDLHLRQSPQKLVHSKSQIPGEILRVSAFCHGSGIEVDGILGEYWRARGVNTAVGAPLWLDFSCTDKGETLSLLCKKLGISLADVAAFGDSYNDLPMLRVAGQPWLMDIARPELKAQFPRQCHSVDEVLRQYLRENERHAE